MDLKYATSLGPTYIFITQSAVKNGARENIASKKLQQKTQTKSEFDRETFKDGWVKYNSATWGCAHR